MTFGRPRCSRSMSSGSAATESDMNEGRWRLESYKRIRVHAELD